MSNPIEDILIQHHIESNETYEEEIREEIRKENQVVDEVKDNIVNQVNEVIDNIEKVKSVDNINVVSENIFNDNFVDDKIKEQLSLELPSSFDTIQLNKMDVVNAVEVVENKSSFCCFFNPFHVYTVRTP